MFHAMNSTRHTHLTKAYDSTAGNQPCLQHATTSAVPLHPHAQAMQHCSGAANFVEAGFTKRHTAQRKASGAATAEQHMSYAYTPPWRHHVRSSRKAYREGAVRALARGQYASLARPSLATHCPRSALPSG